MIYSLDNVKAVIFDLDGTLYLGQNSIAGAVETVWALNDKGLEIGYLTNSSVKNRSFYYDKLSQMGFPVKLENVFSCGYVLAKFLYKQNFSKIYCIGSQELINEIKYFGIGILVEYDKNEKPDAVVIGLDLDFNIEKIQNALNYLISDSCQFIICNADKSYPVEDGIFKPGAGAIVSAVEYVSGRKHDYMVGKPGIAILDAFFNEKGYTSSDIVVIGDSFESDIMMAKNAGCCSILINDKDVSANDDYFCVKKIEDILNILNIN